MSINLKPYYDAAVAAEADVQRIMQEMDTLYKADKKADALAMRPNLAAAQAKSKEDGELYRSMLSASDGSNAPQNFVPAGGQAQQQQASGKKKLTRQAFDTLDSAERMKFIHDGGQITENAQEVSNG